MRCFAISLQEFHPSSLEALPEIQGIAFTEQHNMKIRMTDQTGQVEQIVEFSSSYSVAVCTL